LHITGLGVDPQQHNVKLGGRYAEKKRKKLRMQLTDGLMLRISER
jgi:hypothetical protein